MNTTKHVEFHARTIVAKIQRGELMLGVTDFSRTPITAAQARTSVEFEAGISREEAMAVLTALLKVIEAHGLPKTCLLMPHEDARNFERMLKQFGAEKRHYDRLSSSSLLKNPRHGESVVIQFSVTNRRRLACGAHL